jgi:hypothetical protein
MVTIRIGSETRPVEEADETWINQQVGNRQQEGLPVCVEVRIRTGTLDVILSTPACGSGRGGSRAPRPDEAAIIEAWRRLHLASDEFSRGNVVAFIKQLRELL